MGWFGRGQISLTNLALKMNVDLMTDRLTYRFKMFDVSVWVRRKISCEKHITVSWNVKWSLAPRNTSFFFQAVFETAGWWCRSQGTDDATDNTLIRLLMIPVYCWLQQNRII